MSWAARRIPAGAPRAEALPNSQTYGESGGLRPNVAVVAADDGVLHHLGGDQLVVDVGLPRHDEGGVGGSGGGGGEARGVTEGAGESGERSATWA